MGEEHGSWEQSPLYFIPPRCQVRERGEGRLKPPHSLNIGVFNVCKCSTNEVKKGEIGKIFLRRRLVVCALSQNKLKQSVGCGGTKDEGRGGPFTDGVVAEMCS